MSNQDLLYRYLFEEYEVRGELVQLDSTYRHIVDAQNYPVQVQHLLGELLVATSLLTATLKFEGSHHGAAAGGRSGTSGRHQRRQQPAIARRGTL